MHKKTIIAVVAVALIAVVAYAVVIAPSLNFARKTASPEEAKAKEAVCDVLVANPRGLPLVKNGDLVIEAVSCQQQYVSNCARFGVFSDAGSLRLEGEGGLGSATDLKIDEGSSQTFSLSWCGSKLTNALKAKLYNEDNGLIQTKEVRLQ